MTTERKSSSPLVDALRLFFRNPSAVVSLLLILLLASSAITGKVFTGKEPTPAQQELIAEAEELGDTVDLEVNPLAVSDPGETTLKDKFLPPFSTSKMTKEEWQERYSEKVSESVRESEAFKAQQAKVEPKFYWLGTDHLGRDVLAQLWAGSSISLTIGFLAVGISVFLGVTLGGISGYFGKRPVRLPMMIMLLSALIGGMAIPAESPTIALVFFAIASIAFGFQMIVAVMGKRFRPVIGFGVIALLVSSVFAFNYYIEHETPEGRIMQDAQEMQSLSREVLLLTRDLGREKKTAENGLPGAKPDEWFVEQQLRLDVAYRNLLLQEKHYQLVEYLTDLEKDERLGRDMLDRAEHLRNHIDDAYTAEKTPDELDALPKEERKLYTKYSTRKATADKLEKDGQAKLDRADAIRDAIAPWVEKAKSTIETERETMEFEDFDFDSLEARTNKLLETDLALKRIDRVVLFLKHAEAMSAAGAEAEFSEESTGDDLAKLATEREKALQADLKKLEGKKDDESVEAGAKLQKKLSETASAKGLGDSLTELDKSIEEATKTVEKRLEWLGKPEEELTEAQKKDLEALTTFDYTANATPRDPYFAAVESSETLLNRRAEVRANFLKKYEADAKNRFEDTGGVYEAKMLDGSYRYSVYRMTRHFIAVTIMILLLIVSALIAAAAAQGAAEDIKGPLSKAFIPTISVDDLVMRFTEIMLTIPVIYLILAVLAMFKKDVYIVMAVIGLTSWMGTTRFVRAEILSLREQDFIQ
ncbi:MAG: hypothetical protein KDB29_07995, partial [Planctomycetes bacterium]|nr:hypothetical protein [Planctomycetota bacterium]